MPRGSPRSWVHSFALPVHTKGICISPLRILMTTAQCTTGCPSQHTCPWESWGLTLLSWASGVLAVRTMRAVT